MRRTESRIRLACLGVGNPHTSARVRALRERSDFEVVAAADGEPQLLERFTTALGIKPMTDDDIISDTHIDAVMIHSTTDRMAEYACRAMEAGKIVFLEKPGGQTVDDLRRVCDVADKTGALCHVGYSFRYSPVTELVDSALQNGSLGKVLQVRAHGAVSYGRAGKAPMNREGNMGGSIFVIGCHMLDLMVHHFGLPKTVNARIPKFGTLMGPETSREDAGVAIMNYPNMIASFDFCSWDPLPWAETWEINVYGTEGVLRARPLPRCVSKFETPNGSRAGGWSTWKETSFPLSWTNEKAGWTSDHADINNPDFYEREMSDFAEAIKTGRSATISPVHALDVCALMDALYRSSANSGAEIWLGVNSL